MPAFSRDLERTLSKAMTVAGDVRRAYLPLPDYLDDTASAAKAAGATLNHCFIASREV